MEHQFAAIIPGTRWMHVNGHVYKVLHLAIQNDKETERYVVVHQGEHDGRVWVRGAHNFLGKHASGAKRFTRVED